MSITNKGFSIMRRTIHVWENAKFTWIDVTDPSLEDAIHLEETYRLSHSAVQDCLEPVHLPHFVVGESWCELLLRGFDSESARSDTVQDVTRKLVIFWGEGFLITVKRKDPPFFPELVYRIVNELGNADAGDAGKDTRAARELREECVVKIAKAVVLSFDPALESIEHAIDMCEAHSQSGATGTPDAARPGAGSAELRNLYALKRKATVLRRTLWRTVGVLESARTEFAEKKQARWRRVCELTQRSHFYSEELEQAVASVMNLQLAVSNLHIAEASHRTNEVVRTLTLFSVVFLPLSFIAGVYGMNFETMPELRKPYGYFWTLGVMALVALSLVVWFMRRGYLRKDWWHRIVRQGAAEAKRQRRRTEA